MDIFIAVIVGISIGRLVSVLLLRKARVGVLRLVDCGPHEPPAIMAELDRPVEDICKRKSVVFKVSQK